jgi:hypothetical protein
MLNGEGCQELGRVRNMAASRDATVLQDVPKDVQKLAGRIVRKPNGVPEALHRPEATVMVSDTDN